MDVYNMKSEDTNKSFRDKRYLSALRNKGSMYPNFNLELLQ